MYRIYLTNIYIYSYLNIGLVFLRITFRLIIGKIVGFGIT